MPLQAFAENPTARPHLAAPSLSPGDRRRPRPGLQPAQPPPAHARVTTTLATRRPVACAMKQRHHHPYACLAGRAMRPAAPPHTRPPHNRIRAPGRHACAGARRPGEQAALNKLSYSRFLPDLPLVVNNARRSWCGAGMSQRQHRRGGFARGRSLRASAQPPAGGVIKGELDARNCFTGFKNVLIHLIRRCERSSSPARAQRLILRSVGRSSGK
jgi:hypothetical protein